MADGEPIRIVHCFRSPVGGIFRHVRDLMDAQVEAGHKVGIVCDSSTGGDFEDKLFRTLEGKAELGIIRVPMQRHIGPGDVAAAWRTYKAVRSMQPHILHGHGAKGGVYARTFGTLMRAGGNRVGRLYSPHGGSLHYDADTATGKLFFAIERLLERATDMLLFVAQYESRTYVAKIGEPNCANRVVYNGVTDPEFEPVKPVRGAADFLFIGMMRDLKGPDIFLDALARASRASGKKLTAHMVGDGQDRPQLIEAAGAADYPADVTFHMPMPAREAFALARTVVIPSRAEAMPYIVLEALAAGKPLIASRVGGIPEILGENSPALIEPDAGELADRMMAALSDPEGFARGLPELATLKSRFSARAMAASIERAYRDILDPEPQAQPARSRA